MEWAIYYYEISTMNVNQLRNRLVRSTQVEHDKISLGTGATTLEKGVEAMGPENLSCGLLLTQSVVRTGDGGTSYSSLHNATSVFEILEPKGLVPKCCLDLNSLVVMTVRICL